MQALSGVPRQETSCFVQGMLDDAIMTYKEAIAREPNFPEAYNNLVTPNLAKNMTDRALLRMTISSLSKNSSTHVAKASYRLHLPQAALLPAGQCAARGEPAGRGDQLLHDVHPAAVPGAAGRQRTRPQPAGAGRCPDAARYTAQTLVTMALPQEEHHWLGSVHRLSIIVSLGDSTLDRDNRQRA